MELLLDGDKMCTEEAFYDAIDGAALAAGFEGYGRNLDALWDVLTKILPPPVEIRWVNANASRRAIGPRADQLIQVMRDAETEMGRGGFQLRLEL